VERQSNFRHHPVAAARGVEVGMSAKEAARLML
jgi:hypothetical protein